MTGPSDTSRSPVFELGAKGRRRTAEETRDYWDARAREGAGRPAATTKDVHLRELEISTIVDVLREVGVPQGASILDLGCGDGYSTLRVAKETPHAFFEGIDYSESMVRVAKQRLEESTELRERIIFRVGDATRLAEACGNSMYDVVITDRCLINLESSQVQYDTIRQIAGRVKPGGCCLIIENFIEGHDRMNEARARMGLPDIPVRWHNLYFEEKEFREKVGDLFDEVEFRDFSSAYYYATRVLYSKMCHEKGEEPDYLHAIHRLAVLLPWFGDFSPIRMVLLRKPRTGEAISTVDEAFEQDKAAQIEALGGDAELRAASLEWIANASRHKYSYNFCWLGRPIIQFPADIVALQEIIWDVRPDLIVEAGIARGGSVIFYASMLELLGGDGRVVGIDIDIRPHNRAAVEHHPLFRRIIMIEGSSTDPEVVAQVGALAERSERVLVVLDSSHTHVHVLQELELYSPMVGKGSYVVVLDTIVEEMPEELFRDRPWGKGNNPMTAVRAFLASTDRFVVDRAIESKLLLSVAPSGYLKCVKD